MQRSSATKRTSPWARAAFHGGIAAVRCANTVDPHRKIRDGRPAVVPVAAVAGLFGGGLFSETTAGSAAAGVTVT